MNETTSAPKSGREDSNERLAWKRPMLRRLNANRAETGSAGGGDHGANMQS
jgi:hypothetical protein